MRIHSRRTAVAAIASSLAALAPSFATAFEIKPREDEGIVVCGAYFWMVRDVSFRRLGTNKHFTIIQQPFGAQTPQAVKAGRYYLWTYSPMATDIHATQYQPPENDRDTLEIAPGTVTYLGDIFASQAVDSLHPITMRIVVRTATLREAVKTYPWLAHYPLRVVLQGKAPVPLPWDSVMQSIG
jgi:hypothetical protein